MGSRAAHFPHKKTVVVPYNLAHADVHPNHAVSSWSLVDRLQLRAISSKQANMHWTTLQTIINVALLSMATQERPLTARASMVLADPNAPKSS